MDNAIEIKNVSKFFGDFMIDNLTLNVPSGSVVGLIGGNGAGKTTTIKLIMGALRKDRGEIKVLGVNNEDKEFTEIKNDIGVVLDEAYFPEEITPKTVNNIMKRTYKNWDEDLYFGYIEKFKLPFKKPFKKFSRGMKMKLAISVALSHNSRLLILDEATSGLDPFVREEILDIFNEFTRDENNSILISSHIISDLEKICDYIAFIKDGKLIFFEEKDRLLEEYALIKLSKEDFLSLPEYAVKGVRVSSSCVTALVLKSEISDIFKTEHTTIEDIVIFLSKGDEEI